MSIDIDLGDTLTGLSDKRNILASIICNEIGEAYLVDEPNGIEIDVIYADEISAELNPTWNNQEYTRDGIECYPAEITEVIKD